MSGHSHWHGIRHKKALTDAKKASVFTKVGNMISIAARHGGDPEMNFRLRLAIDQARASNMPKDRIEKAIKRGTGELKEGAAFEELVYEAYGPGQVALLIGTATDNRNRTFGEVRTLLTKNGGKIVPEGSVSYLFRPVGEIEISLDGRDPDEAELTAIEAGAEDIERTDGSLYAYVPQESLQSAKESLETAGFTVSSASLSFLPTQRVTVTDEEWNALDRLLEILEEHADVQTVWDNLENTHD
ncbi:MAG: YebC/PmpR family DNA-binding transcriptional regulator [Candidatus Moranbacteria bacterium]|nr:YebC/PmpR family DNA-binding transcriptional regulator [Candidatus Moranbacteria bacterium]